MSRCCCAHQDQLSNLRGRETSRELWTDACSRRGACRCRGPSTPASRVSFEPGWPSRTTGNHNRVTRMTRTTAEDGALPDFRHRRQQGLGKCGHGSRHGQLRRRGDAPLVDGHGAPALSQASRLLISADGGGSNGYRVHLWKMELQALGDELRTPITVCHLPAGTSKGNKIEHPCFRSPICLTLWQTSSGYSGGGRPAACSAPALSSETHHSSH